MKPATPEAPAPVPADLTRPSLFGLKRNQVQELWFSTQARPWASLVVVPASPRLSAQQLAKALAEVGANIRGSPVHHLVGEGRDSAAIVRLLVEMMTYTKGRDLAVVSLDPVVENAGGVSVARAADAALLVAELGQTGVASARKTVELVGAEKFLGCVTVQGG